MILNRVGQQLGNYRLIHLLGEGGFAQVYLGEHMRLKTNAAIKVLHTQVADADRDSFLSEAQTIANLDHPHIVRVLDFDIQAGIPFLVMSYAPNGTLRRLHPKGTQLPLPTIVAYVKQLADALQYAHDEKLIHRDIKPENMLVGRRNEVLLSDFGIALIAQSSRSQSTQDAMGTVAYMSPEQIQGKPRPASDQYSLGIVVYEWLCGDRPFHGSFTELCTQHMFATPAPLREKVPTLPPSVEQVVLTALAKDPRQRFASVQAFATALEQASQAAQGQFSAGRPPVPVQPFSSQQLPPLISQNPSALIPTLPPSQEVPIAHFSATGFVPTGFPEHDALSSKPNSAPLVTFLTRPPITPTPSKPSSRSRGLSRFRVAFLVVLALLIVGSAGLIYTIVSTSSNPAPTATTAPTSAPTTAPTTAPTAAPTTAPSALIQMAMATVNGTSETILTNAQGLTLYYRTSDSPPSTVCSGGCAGAWPPLLAPSSGSPTSTTSLPGKLTVVTDANGSQVEYNGHPLYTYAGDSAAGQTIGEGIGGVWYVVTPSLT